MPNGCLLQRKSIHTCFSETAPRSRWGPLLVLYTRYGYRLSQLRLRYSVMGSILGFMNSPILKHCQLGKMIRFYRGMYSLYFCSSSPVLDITHELRWFVWMASEYSRGGDLQVPLRVRGWSGPNLSLETSRLPGAHRILTRKHRQTRHKYCI